MVVLDTSAVLAFLRNEPGGDAIGALLPIARMSAVNLSEAVSKLVDRGAQPDIAVRRIRSLRIEMIPFAIDHAEIAGELRQATRHLGLSLGDRACLALELHSKEPVYTADRDWAKLDIGVEVRVIR